MKDFATAGRIAVLVALALLVVVSIALAQSGDGASASPSPDYDLSWWTVDGGGHTFSEGDGYSLGGTIGQPDAGEMSDGGYAVSGGFWVSVVEYLYRVFLPLIFKNYGP